jgi:hypothetical protein
MTWPVGPIHPMRLVICNANEHVLRTLLVALVGHCHLSTLGNDLFQQARESSHVAF